jgi:hypothetical protein
VGSYCALNLDIHQEYWVQMKGYLGSSCESNDDDDDIIHVGAPEA